MPGVADPLLQDLAAAGRLRLALFPSFFYRRDSASGELCGVGIEIGRALAKRIGVALAVDEFASPPKVVHALAEGTTDVALLGIDPARAAEVDFSAPLLAADFTYLVAADSPVRSIADVDRPGVRIALVRHHAMDTALTLTHAQRVHADTPEAAFALFSSGAADVLAGIRPGLLMYVERMPGARVLADRYGRNVIALAVKKGRTGWLSYVDRFAEAARLEGTVSDAISVAGLRGVEVAADP